MTLKRFKTNRRLWLAVSLALFTLLWFVVRYGKDDDMHAAGLFIVAVGDPEVIFAILFLALIFAIPALAIGWVIHCLIVLVMDFVKVRSGTAA